jgi:hypothetical protein
MSLDIKVKRKNLVAPIEVQSQPPVKPLVPHINIESSPKSPLPPQAIKNNKYGYGWWILFIILVLLFVGVIYIIWHEQNSKAKKTVTKNEQSAGIVSTFVPENKPGENIPTPTELEEFSQAVVNVAASDFTDKLFLYKQEVSASSTENISVTATDVYATAQLTLATMQKQYSFLQQSINQVAATSSIEIYTNQIDDYVQRVQGEFNIIATLIDLESETSFSPEIVVSLEKLDKYFQEIKSLIQIVSEVLNPDLQLMINDNISTTTTSSTSTEIQATSTVQ